LTKNWPWEAGFVEFGRIFCFGRQIVWRQKEITLHFYAWMGKQTKPSFEVSFSRKRKLSIIRG